MRTAIWVASSGLAQIFGGTVAYGLAIRVDNYSMDAWKITFILFGCLAIFVGLIAFFLLPDSQLNAPFLSADLRNLAVERVRINQQGIGNKKFKWYQIREIFTDAFFWGIFIFGIACNIPAGGITNFFSLIIVDFGFTPEQSLLYGCPAGGFSIIIILLWGFVSYKWGCRIFAGIASLVLVLVGVIMMVATPEEHRVTRLMGYYLTMGIPAAEASAASLISSNVAG
jgi:MFS transporter, ACS family, allantoate permease